MNTVVLQLTSCYKHHYSPSGVICCVHVDLMLWDAIVGKPLSRTLAANLLPPPKPNVILESALF